MSKRPEPTAKMWLRAIEAMDRLSKALEAYRREAAFEEYQRGGGAALPPPKGRETGTPKAPASRRETPVPADLLAWVTPERAAVLRALYPTDATEPVIRSEMLKHPGPPLPAWREIAAYASRILRLDRRGRSFQLGKSRS